MAGDEGQRSPAAERWEVLIPPTYLPLYRMCLDSLTSMAKGYSPPADWGTIQAAAAAATLLHVWVGPQRPFAPQIIRAWCQDCWTDEWTETAKLARMLRLLVKPGRGEGRFLMFAPHLSWLLMVWRAARSIRESGRLGRR